MAQHLSTVVDIPVVSLCTKQRRTRRQTRLDRVHRFRNVADAFRCRPNLSLEGVRTLLLVDDVTTTGATLNAMAHSITQVYPHLHLWGIVVARHG